MSNFVTNTSHKYRKTALLLCIFGGLLGFHYFYVGRFWKGVLFFCTFVFFTLGWMHDISKILHGRFRDQYGYPLIEW